MLLMVPGAVSTDAQELPRFTPPAPPPVSAKAVFVYDAEAGVPLFARDADLPLAPASLTKIVTALVVIEHAALDETVTIQAEDIVDESQSRAQLVAGDTLTVRDLLVGLLVPSGNDAALALARHVGAKLPQGSAADPVGRFVAEMNALVADRGLTNTRFANPSGLDAADHHASARDLALLTAEAVANPVLAEAMGTVSATLASTNGEGYLVNTTHDLVLEGIAVAGKTGTTERAGGCLITVTEEGGNRIVTVLLGAEWYINEAGNPTSTARYDDTRTLLAALTQQYAWVSPTLPEAVPGLPQELAAWNATLGGTASVPVPRDRLSELDYRLVLDPPAAPGAPVGAVLFVLGSEVLAEQPLVQSGVAAVEPGAHGRATPERRAA